MNPLLPPTAQAPPLTTMPWSGDTAPADDPPNPQVMLVRLGSALPPPIPSQHYGTTVPPIPRLAGGDLVAPTQGIGATAALKAGGGNVSSTTTTTGGVVPSPPHHESAALFMASAHIGQRLEKLAHIVEGNQVLLRAILFHLTPKARPPPTAASAKPPSTSMASSNLSLEDQQQVETGQGSTTVAPPPPVSIGHATADTPLALAAFLSSDDDVARRVFDASLQDASSSASARAVAALQPFLELGSFGGSVTTQHEDWQRPSPSHPPLLYSGAAVATVRSIGGPTAFTPSVGMTTTTGGVAAGGAFDTKSDAAKSSSPRSAEDARSRMLQSTVHIDDSSSVMASSSRNRNPPAAFGLSSQGTGPAAIRRHPPHRLFGMLSPVTLASIAGEGGGRAESSSRSSLKSRVSSLCRRHAVQLNPGDIVVRSSNNDQQRGQGAASRVTESSAGLRDARFNATVAGSNRRHPRVSLALLPDSEIHTDTVATFASKLVVGPEKQATGTSEEIHRRCGEACPAGHVVKGEENAVDDEASTDSDEDLATAEATTTATNGDAVVAVKLNGAAGRRSDGQLFATADGKYGGLQRQKAFNGDSVPILMLDVAFVILSTAICCIAFSVQNPRTRADVTRQNDAFAVVVGIQVFTMVWFVFRFLIQNEDEWNVYDTIRLTSRHYVTRKRRIPFLIDLFIALPLESFLWPWQPLVAMYLLPRHLCRLVPSFALCSSSNPLSVDRPLFMLLNVVSVAFILVFTMGLSFSFTEETVSVLEAIYWAFATVLTVGYGDIVATNAHSRWVSIVAMLIGSGVVSTVTAVATMWMTRKDRLQQDLDEKKLLMASMMKHYGVPWAVQKTVIASFPALLDKSSDNAFAVLLEQLPDVVRIRLWGYCNLRLLRKITYFEEVPDRAGLKLARCLKHCFLEAGSIVVEEGDQGAEMYFVLRGEVKICKMVSGEPIVLATLRGGSFFGEMALMNDEPRKASAVTTEFSDLLVLGKEDFRRLRHAFPTMFQPFEAEVARRRAQTTQMVQRVDATLFKDDAEGEEAPPGRVITADDRISTQPPSVVTATENNTAMVDGGHSARAIPSNARLSASGDRQAAALPLNSAGPSVPLAPSAHAEQTPEAEHHGEDNAALRVVMAA